MAFQQRKFRGRDSGFNRGPRETHKVICSDCGAEAEVPFKPIEGRPVYCKECYKKHKNVE
jgi:CxxC-x17-CxxC domain-containing protein